MALSKRIGLGRELTYEEMDANWDYVLQLANMLGLLGMDKVDGLQAALDGKTGLGHGHAIGDVAGLQTAIDGKAASVHSHAIAGVTGLQAALDGKALSGHIHSISGVTGLQTALDAKASTALATQGSAGLMSAADKTKLDNFDGSGGGGTGGGTLADTASYMATIHGWDDWYSKMALGLQPGSAADTVIIRSLFDAAVSYVIDSVEWQDGQYVIDNSLTPVAVVAGQTAQQIDLSSTTPADDLRLHMVGVFGEGDATQVAHLSFNLAATLSNPRAINVADVTADVTVDTNGPNGDLAVAVWPLGTALDFPADIRAGTGAVFATSIDNPGTGTNTFSVTGLTAGTNYVAKFVQNNATDGSGSDSEVVFVVFTTVGAGGGTGDQVFFDDFAADTTGNYTTENGGVITYDAATDDLIWTADIATSWAGVITPSFTVDPTKTYTVVVEMVNESSDLSMDLTAGAATGSIQAYGSSVDRNIYNDPQPYTLTWTGVAPSSSTMRIKTEYRGAITVGNSFRVKSITVTEEAA